MTTEDQGHFPHQVQISAYGNGGFRFAELSHRGSLLCLPSGMHSWAVTQASELTLESLSAALDVADKLDVLLIGLGDDISAIDPAIRQAFREAGVVIEAVATRPSVHTYNVLMDEKRAVGAAFIAVERPGR